MELGERYGGEPSQSLRARHSDQQPCLTRVIWPLAAPVPFTGILGICRYANTYRK